LFAGCGIKTGRSYPKRVILNNLLCSSTGEGLAVDTAEVVLMDIPGMHME